MRFAYDKVLAKTVSADDARRNTRDGDRPGRYCCPNRICRATVTVKGRDWPEPFSAHLNNQASPSCEDYYPGIGYSWDPKYYTPVRLNEREQLSRPGLELWVDPSYRDWKLTYRMPRHDLKTSHVLISVEPDSEAKKVSTSVLRERSLYLSVIPSSRPIGYVRDIAGDTYFDSDYFSPPTFQLNPVGLNSFHASGATHHRAVGAKLFWGTSYFVIWQDDAPLKIPERIIVKELGRRWHWRCALIALPRVPSDDLRHFLEDATAFDLESKKAVISVVYPHASLSGAAEQRVQMDLEIILNVSRSAARPLKDGILVESKDALTLIDLDESPETFLILKPHTPQDEYYFVRYADEPAILIHMTNTIPQSASDTVLALEVDSKDGSKERVPFFSMRAHKLLAAVRWGRYKDARILAAGNIEGTVYQRTLGARSRPINIVHTHMGENLTPLTGLDLYKLLRTRAELHLDFGANGYQLVPEYNTVGQANPDKALIARCHWLLSMANRFDEEASAAVDKSLRGDAGELTALLRHVEVPIHLQVHLTALRYQLEQR